MEHVELALEIRQTGAVVEQVPDGDLLTAV
jgi:fructose-1,6-bisphosphatase/sedoheptulose 1,7-bisphosphatase-like protein